MTEGRALGAFESAQVLTNAQFAFNVVTVLRLDPGPEPDVLRRAVAVLYRRHPLLRARVINERGRYRFRLDATPPPLQIVPHPWPENWPAVAERELNTGFDVARGPLFRLVALLSPGGRANRLVMSAQHAIFDGASGAHLVGELLALCAGLAAGREPAGFDPLPLNGPAEQYFPAAFRGWRGALRRLGYLGRQAADEAAARWHGRGGPRPAAAARCRVHPLRLSAAATTALTRRCRRERVTVNGALCAAQLSVAARRSPELPALRHFVFANLRPYLTPGLGPEHLGCYVAMLPLLTPVRDVDCWGLARRITAQVHAAVKRGDRYAGVLASRALMQMVLRGRRFRMGHAGLAYGGGLRLAARYGEIGLTSLNAFVSNFALGPPLTANARRLGGELYWDMVYLDSDMDADEAAATAARVLEALQI